MHKISRKSLKVAAIVIAAVYLTIGVYFSLGFGYGDAAAMLFLWPALFIVPIN
jgi:hypothetical protein